MAYPILTNPRPSRKGLRCLNVILWFVLLVIPVHSICLAESSTRTVTDFFGRQVVIPKKIDRVLSTFPPITNIVYMLAPKKLLGWNFKPDGFYMPAQYAELPVVGGWFGLQSGHYETMLAFKPDVVLYQSMLDYPFEEGLENVRNLQRNFGTVPVIGVSGSHDITRVDESIRLLGNILDVQEKARELAAVHQDILRTVTDRIQTIPLKDRVRVYYAERPDGLSTDPSGSRHARLITLCGGLNVADCALKQGMGLTRVSMEQVLHWNPEVIIAEQRSIFDEIAENPLWRTVEAVQRKRVYLVPNGPFCWFDRPPGITTIPGILWTAAVLYPDRFPESDLKELTRRFYADFYHHRLTERELSHLLNTHINTD